MTQDTVTHVHLSETARSLQDCLREFAGFGDTHRRTAPEVIDALTDAGMFRLFTPRRFGGHQVDVETLLDITEILGEADGSAAWLVGLAATATWVAAHAHPRATAEIFGADPDARLAGGAAGTGTARSVDGGVVVNGRWAYASGSWDAHWAVVATQSDSLAGGGMAFCLIPIDEIRLEDTWYMAGLRGTGSNTLIATEVFVPDHRILPLSSIGESSPDLGPLYRLPMRSVGSLTLMGPLLGIGNAALAHVIGAAATKGVPQTAFRTQRESVGVQLQVADAALRLRTAKLHTHAAAAAVTHHAITGQALDPISRAQFWAETAYAGQQLITAVNGLLSVHGSSGLADSDPLQKMFRDISTGTRHAALYSAVSHEVLGKALLGVPEQVVPVI